MVNGVVMETAGGTPQGGSGKKACLFDSIMGLGYNINRKEKPAYAAVIMTTKPERGINPDGKV
jgi:hypothetical protein